MVTKIESIIENRLQTCEKCTEPTNEVLQKLYVTPHYAGFIDVCRTDAPNPWKKIYQTMCKNIEGEPEKLYRTLRTILQKFATVKNSALIHAEIKKDYQSGELRKKYIKRYVDEIAGIQAKIDIVNSISDRDLLINTCKSHHLFEYGNPEEVLNVLKEVCLQQTGKNLDEMIEAAK